MTSHATGDGNIPTRDAKKKGLKRIMTVGGVYGTRNYTVKDLRDQKGNNILTETVPFSVEEAAAAEEAGIDTMKVRFDPKNPDLAIAIRKAAPNTFMAFSCPLIAAATKDEAVRLGYKAMEIGADAVMTQWSPSFIEAATEAGIPVQAHAGLVPRRSTWTGGLKAVGKSLEEAIWIYNQIKTYENSGAYAVEVEVIPEDLLIQISIQFLFADDILGNNGPPHVRHSKQYRNLYKMKQEMQKERIAGFKEFIQDVKSGQFPKEEHIIATPNGLIDDFLKTIKD